MTNRTFEDRVQEHIDAYEAQKCEYGNIISDALCALRDGMPPLDVRPFTDEEEEEQ